MGKVLLVYRLAVRDLRHHAAQAVLLVVAIAAVSLVATLVPAIRAARTSTVSAINDVARPPRRRGGLIRLSAGLPVSALFGVRLVGRRPRRALLSAANIAVTVAGIVAVLCFHATVHRSGWAPVTR